MRLGCEVGNFSHLSYSTLYLCEVRTHMHLAEADTLHAVEGTLHNITWCVLTHTWLKGTFHKTNPTHTIQQLINKWPARRGRTSSSTPRRRQPKRDTKVPSNAMLIATKNFWVGDSRNTEQHQTSTTPTLVTRDRGVTMVRQCRYRLLLGSRCTCGRTNTQPWLKSSLTL